MTESNDNNNENMEAQVEAPIEHTPVAETNQPSSWISEDLKNQSNLKDFSNPDDLAKSYLELQKMVGNSVRIPSEDASEEAKQAFLDKIKGVDGVLYKNDPDFYSRLGKPESPDQYRFTEKLDADLIETVPGITDELGHFQEIAHKLNLTTEQAQGLVDMRLSTLKESQLRDAKAYEAGQAQLKEMWGADYENRLDAAKQVAKIYSDKYGDAMNELLNSSARNNPMVINMMAELASLYKEQGHVGAQTVKFGITPSEALQQAKDMRENKNHPVNNPQHPEHQAAVAKMKELYSIAYPE